MRAGTSLLLVGLAIHSAVGCATLPSLSSGPKGDVAAANAGSEDGLPKRQPKPATCVACGELYEKAATDPGHSPAEVQDLRSKARLSYQQALLSSPNDLPALMALARLYAAEEDHERATTTYLRAIAAYPNKAAPRYELGMCYARSKNWELAIASLRKAVEADPENRAYGHTYGLCLARAQHYDESFALLSKLEGAANAHYDLARMLHHLEQDEASREHLRQALAENPEHPGAQQLLAALDGAAGNPAYPIVPAAAESPSADSAAAIGRPVRVAQP